MNIKKLCEKYGAANILVFGIIDSNLTDVPEYFGTLDERRYLASEGYKISILPLDSERSICHFYQTDFNSLVDSGLFRVFVNTKTLED